MVGHEVVFPSRAGMNRPRSRVRSDSGCLTSAARRSLTVGRRQQSRSDGGDIDRVSTRLSHPEPTATDLFGDFSQSVVMLPSNRASSLGMIMTTFVAIDFETANHRRDSACAVGLATGCNGRIVASRTYTIRPPTPQFSFTGIHGVRWEDVRDAPTFGDLWPTLRGWIDNVEFLVAHNASFDRSVLLACCARYRLRAPRTPFTCTVQLARAQWGIYSTTLPDVCRQLRILLHHHDAGSDAEACARIVLAAEAAGHTRRWPSTS